MRKNYALECGALALEETGENETLRKMPSPPRSERGPPTRVIGMGLASLLQVMVLPQGKFERF